MIDRAGYDRQFMARALELAEKGRLTAHPNPVVGCVLVNGGQIIGEGFHRRCGENHAEINALAAAGGNAQGATAYVTLEPCSHQGRTPPCCDALIGAGITRVVVAMEDPNPKVAGSGLQALTAADIEVELLDTQGAAEALNPGFIKRMQGRGPWVRVKLASSLDGGTALANGDSRWITSASSREDVHRWRGRSGAIVTGIGTLLADDPQLTVRLDEPARVPLRVVMDSAAKMSPQCELLQQPGPVLHCTQSGTPGCQHSQVETTELPVTATGLDLSVLLKQLADREVNEVWVEAGSRLATSFLRAGLVDELIVYLAPVLLGEGALPLLQMPALAQMAARTELELVDVCRFEGDVRLTYRP